MKPLSGPKKQTQFKPNFLKAQNELKIACQKIWPYPLGLNLIFLLTIFNMPAKKQRFGFPQGGVPLM